MSSKLTVNNSLRNIIDDAVSKTPLVEFGIPQGSIVGPVLFAIYLNDLLSVPERCISASYVHDCKLYLSFPPALNDDLRKICQW